MMTFDTLMEPPMRKTSFVKALLLVLFLTFAAAPGARAATSVPKLLSAWMGEYETFIAWLCKQRGWDREAGFDLTMMPFESGKNIVESLAAYDWAVAGCGVVPALMTPLSDYLYLVAVASDESACNALYVRADSPILQSRGTNPLYPDVYGSAVSVGGSHVLYPRTSSAHYLLDTWLSALGLSEKDVKLQEMEPTAGLNAFTGGVGDIVALWAPQTYEAESRGFKAVATSKDCHITQLVMLVANKRFADGNPEKVQAFLSMYMRGVAAMRSEDAEQLATEYMRFYKEWTGEEIEKKHALADLQSHKNYDLDEQLTMFQPDGSIHKILADTVDFSIRHQQFSHAQIDAMMSKTRVTSRFLEMLKK